MAGPPPGRRTYGSGAADAGEPTATTGADGAYAFQLTADGTDTVRIVTPGGFTQKTAKPGPVGVSGGATVGGVNFGVRQQTTPQPPVVRGTVYADANGNGVRDAGEAGVGGGTIFLDTNSNGTPDTGEPVAVPDGDGSYALTAPAAGTARVRYLPPAGVEVGTANPVVLDLAAGETRTGVDFGTTTPAGVTLIRGSVFNDANGNGTRGKAVRPGRPRSST